MMRDILMEYHQGTKTMSKKQQQIIRIYKSEKWQRKGIAADAVYWFFLDAVQSVQSTHYQVSSFYKII